METPLPISADGPPVGVAPPADPHAAAKARRLVLRFRVYIAVAAVLLLFESVTAALYPKMPIEDFYETPAEMAVGVGSGPTALLVMAVFVVVVVLFCRWVHAANRAARSLGAEGMEFTPGWCVGYFFIPIVNLFLPCRAVREIYLASGPHDDRAIWSEGARPESLGAWWGLWIASSLVGNAKMRMALSENVDVLARSVYVSPVSSLLNIGAAAMAIQVVRAIEQRQADKRRARVFT